MIAGILGARRSSSYNGTLLAALAEAGPGELSLDHALGIERRGAAWALVALGGGLTGSALSYALASRVAPNRTTGPAEEPAREPVRA